MSEFIVRYTDMPVFLILLRLHDLQAISGSEKYVSNHHLRIRIQGKPKSILLHQKFLLESGALSQGNHVQFSHILQNAWTTPEKK